MNVRSLKSPGVKLPGAKLPGAKLPDVGDMLAKAGDAAAFLRSLAHEHRLAILCALAEGPLTVGALAVRLGLAQPKVSQHLGKLRDQGLVVATRHGTSIEYRAVSATARGIVAALQAEFCPSGSTVAAVTRPRRR